MYNRYTILSDIPKKYMNYSELPNIIRRKNNQAVLVGVLHESVFTLKHLEAQIICLHAFPETAVPNFTTQIYVPITNI